MILVHIYLALGVLHWWFMCTHKLTRECIKAHPVVSTIIYCLLWPVLYVTGIFYILFLLAGRFMDDRE